MAPGRRRVPMAEDGSRLERSRTRRPAAGLPPGLLDDPAPGVPQDVGEPRRRILVIRRPGPDEAAVDRPPWEVAERYPAVVIATLDEEIRRDRSATRIARTSRYTPERGEEQEEPDP